ncbi:hypothetical protein EI555_017856 [Monodon monoceros]|uniref:Uncharacterized protein n=1 Tax=Monodon monoceros TaxID=40151 RepID=A0A4U1EII7_MONMO|nr:hypothetical protein EI555_017856 [Monodon monoceros]
MASAAEPPGQAAEYLQELTRIVAAQQELLARRRRRIEELERQVARLSRENAGLLERHRRHLAACARRPDPGPGPQPLGAIPELGGRRDKEGLAFDVARGDSFSQSSQFFSLNGSLLLSFD